MTRLFRTALPSLFALAALAVATPALAGPPLLCHPFDIGSARSLPWNGAQNWWQGDASYSLTNLAADTDALLTPATPVVVRMETLRRAAIYASRDRAVAGNLLRRLVARTQAPGLTPQASALAFLDAAYVAEAFREITLLSNTAEFRDRIDGVRAALGTVDAAALIARSVSARPDDPAIHFAAALIMADKDRGAYREHADRARAGAAHDPLLARNIDHVS
jgi:hypothetical protein